MRTKLKYSLIGGFGPAEIELGLRCFLFPFPSRPTLPDERAASKLIFLGTLSRDVSSID